MLQIQHQPQPQVQAPQAGPVQNPLYYLAQHQSPPAPSTAVFVPSSMFDTTAALPSKSAPVGQQQHSPWHQAPETTSSSSSAASSSSSCGGCTSSAASCYASTLSPVASAAFLLEARLHISQQTHPHSGLQQQQPHSTTMCTFPPIPKPAMWRLDSVPSAEPDMQELGLAAQQQKLSSCVMVK